VSGFPHEDELYSLVNLVLTALGYADRYVYGIKDIFAAAWRERLC